MGQRIFQKRERHSRKLEQKTVRKHMKKHALIFLLLFVCGSCSHQGANDEAPQARAAANVAPNLATGDAVITNQPATVYDRPNGATIGSVDAGETGTITKIASKGGVEWAQVDFDAATDGVVLSEVLSIDDGGQGGSPVAGFTYSAQELTVTFTDQSTDDGSITVWSWAFGDGSVSALQNPVHQYGGAGTYTVSLTVFDDEGLSDDVAQLVTVSQAPPVGSINSVVIAGCSNTDNWLSYASNDPDIDLNAGGGQFGRTIVSYGERTENKGIWDKFKADIDAAGPGLDLAMYMVCQRYSPDKPGARTLDQPFSLPAGQSGSSLYGEKDLVKNILGEMRQILNDKGRQDVPVSVVPMHFYLPILNQQGEILNDNPCERIGSNGILAQWNYVDEINAAGPQSSLLRPGLAFTPLPLLNSDGTPWRMPAVSQEGDVNPSDNCHLVQSYVQGKLMPSFKTMLANF